jgi:hypothetical protein
LLLGEVYRLVLENDSAEAKRIATCEVNYETTLRELPKRNLHSVPMRESIAGQLPHPILIEQTTRLRAFIQTPARR